MRWAFLSVIALSASHCSLAAPFTDETNNGGIPTEWRKPHSHKSIQEIDKISLDTVKSMVKDYATDDPPWNVSQMNYWPSANTWSAIALRDYNAGQEDMKDVVLESIDKTWERFPNFRANEYNDDTLWWGTGAVYQYLAYNEERFLDYAKDTWDHVNQYVITGTNGNNRSFEWKEKCNGSPTSGGVFWRYFEEDDSVNAITTGLFFTLSSWLYDLTNDHKYIHVAKKNQQFIESHLYNTTTSLVDDTIHVKDCSIQPWTFTYNSGKYIEGLSILGDALGSEKYSHIAYKTAVASMTDAPWNGDDGIITEGQDDPVSENDDGRGFKAIYIRGLSELYRRTKHKNESLAKLIKAYITVQANALVDLASDNHNHPSRFGVKWHGPYDGGFAWGQLAALDPIASFGLVQRC